MSFAPQQRPLFRHLDFQKWSEPLVLLTFWLRHVLCATTACTFSTSQLLKVVRSWGVLYILTSKCASRHNGVHFFDISTSKSGPDLVCFVHFDFESASRRVQFFISHLARWLCTRRFSEPTFRPSGATNHWKNTVFRDFPTFSRICIFFLLTLSLLWSALFYSSLLSASSHLCFSSVHVVGSLTSKLPSIMVYDGLCMDKVENRGPKSESVERHFPNHVGKKVKRERERVLKYRDDWGHRTPCSLVGPLPVVRMAWNWRPRNWPRKQPEKIARAVNEHFIFQVRLYKWSSSVLPKSTAHPKQLLQSRSPPPSVWRTAFEQLVLKQVLHIHTLSHIK